MQAIMQASRHSYRQAENRQASMQAGGHTGIQASRQTDILVNRKALRHTTVYTSGHAGGQAGLHDVTCLTIRQAIIVHKEYTSLT